MENIRLSNEFLTINEEEKETWKVTDDLAADWCLDKIKEAKAEFERFRMVAQAKIEQIQARLQAEEEKMNREVAFFESKLREYFESLEKVKETKTQKSYKLPSGILKLKKSKPKFIRDDEKLVKWLEANKLDNLIKIKKSPDWANLKKNVEVVGDKVVNKETGEIVEGVRVEEVAPEFIVEV
ncbi:host-nuclease inhibitor Gam family protein [Caloranaerobacter sp. DY30410]|uniref:host-nuclease inhibitor Gam family protein n=1 Tax=Caloranaerobacter sp. DY30410 TaxID=3238305 RepID=UPI003D08825F